MVIIKPNRLLFYYARCLLLWVGFNDLHWLIFSTWCGVDIGVLKLPCDCRFTPWSYLTSALPEVWLFALGGLLEFVTLYMPKGIVGLMRRRQKEIGA